VFYTSGESKRANHLSTLSTADWGGLVESIPAITVHASPEAIHSPFLYGKSLLIV
jgi:hypothetical protein